MVGVSKTALKLDFSLYLMPLRSPSFPSCWSPGDSLLNILFSKLHVRFCSLGEEPRPLPLSKINERVNGRARILNSYLLITKSIWKIFIPNYDQFEIMLQPKLFKLIPWSENYPKGLFLGNSPIDVWSWCLTIGWDDEKTAIQSVIGLTRLSQISEEVSWIIHGAA